MVKLLAFGSVGLFVLFVLFDGPGDLLLQARENLQAEAALSYQTPASRWVLMTVLSAFAILLLPRQFHVTVVENRSESELNLARFLFPLYLIAINALVLPVAIGGAMLLRPGADPDLYVLQLPHCRGGAADLAADVYRRVFGSNGHGYRFLCRALDHVVE